MGGVASELVGASRERQSRKRKQFHTVELKVRMDCDGCELKVRNTLASMRGTHARMHFISMHAELCSQSFFTHALLVSPNLLN